LARESIDHGISVAQRLGSAIAALCLPVSSSACLVDDLLAAADQGQCIESVAYRMIQQSGSAGAGKIVQAALAALTHREQQQRALGCAGDIAAQAIAAGADPDLVLQATAAGL
jgi:hypothetical protein